MAATGVALAEFAPVSGRTKFDIMHDSLRLNGVDPTSQVIADLAAALVRGYEDAREELATTGRALPGAKEALETLARDPAIHQAVLTGNLRDVARIKLEVSDSISTSTWRAAPTVTTTPTVRYWWESPGSGRRPRTGGEFDGAHTILVGDTPNDVRAGLMAGARVIGVPTGNSTAEELRAAGATNIVPGLADVVALHELREATALSRPSRSASDRSRTWK